MSYAERALTFSRGAETLVGVLSTPRAGPMADLGVVIVVGGPQYRAGSHRQFVLLARGLAAAGYAVLRFDVHGMGDSTGNQEDFRHATLDIAAAVDTLQKEVPGVRQVALWGLCDGASAALLYCQATRDSRVTGLCLANPWVRSEASLARTRVKHYYLHRLGQKAFWQKLIRGEVAMRALGELWQMLRLSRNNTSTSHGLPEGPNQGFQRQMALGWRDFTGRILLLLSAEDYTAREFEEYTAADAAWAQAFERVPAVRHALPGADHTFSRGGTQMQVNELTIHWLAAVAHQDTRTR